ncbi:MAG: cyclic nucleotide-binding domain-containing protein [Anaerolineae bacterium]|nr:cyclic nucleotide-binding domain-containing protein [Anaerolineae bacterium]
MDTMIIYSILKQTGIFSNLDDAQIEKLASITHLLECNTGDIICEEGSASDELYVIMSGEVDIQVDPPPTGYALKGVTRPIKITTLRRAQSFGEMALVSQGIRSASARCAQHDTRLVVIPRQELLQLCEADPRLGYKIMHNLAADLAAKIRKTDRLIQERVSWSRIK